MPQGTRMSRRWTNAEQTLHGISTLLILTSSSWDTGCQGHLPVPRAHSSERIWIVKTRFYSHKDKNFKCSSTRGTRTPWQASNHQEEQNLLIRDSTSCCMHTGTAHSLGSGQSSLGLVKSVSPWRSTDTGIGKNGMILPKANLISDLFNALVRLSGCESSVRFGSSQFGIARPLEVHDLLHGACRG